MRTPPLNSSLSPPDKSGLFQPRVAAGSSAWPSGSPAGTEMLFWGLLLFSGFQRVIPVQNSDEKKNINSWPLSCHVMLCAIPRTRASSFNCYITQNKCTWLLWTVQCFFTSLRLLCATTTDFVTRSKCSSVNNCRRVCNKYYRSPVRKKRGLSWSLFRCKIIAQAVNLRENENMTLWSRSTLSSRFLSLSHDFKAAWSCNEPHASYAEHLSDLISNLGARNQWLVGVGSPGSNGEPG